MPGELTAVQRQTLASLEDSIQRNLQSFVEAGNALLRIRDEELYRKVYGTFDEYCEKRWGFTRFRGYQLIESARVIQNLKSNSEEDGVLTIVNTPLPQNEGQARELAKIPMEKQKAAWKKAVERAPRDKSGKPKVTAAIVKQAAQEAIAEARPQEPDVPTDGTGALIFDKEIAEAFSGREKFADMMNRLSRLKAEAAQLGAAGSYLHRQEFDTHIDNARGALKFAQPFAVCPYCKGSDSKRTRCNACKGRGWVTKQTYDDAPKDLKPAMAGKGAA